MGYIVSGKKQLIFLVSCICTMLQLNKHSKYTYLGFFCFLVVLVLGFFPLKKELVPHLFVRDKL